MGTGVKWEQEWEVRDGGTEERDREYQDHNGETCIDICSLVIAASVSEHGFVYWGSE